MIVRNSGIEIAEDLIEDTWEGELVRLTARSLATNPPTIQQIENILRSANYGRPRIAEFLRNPLNDGEITRINNHINRNNNGFIIAALDGGGHAQMLFRKDREYVHLSASTNLLLENINFHGHINISPINGGIRITDGTGEVLCGGDYVALI
jgi:hypothetical protein